MMMGWERGPWIRLGVAHTAWSFFSQPFHVDRRTGSDRL